MTEPLPSESRRRRQLALCALAAVLGVALIGGVLWWVFRPAPETPRQAGIEPARETTALPLPGVPSQESSETTTPASPTSSVSPGAGALQRAALIAFRVGETVYVADEDGSSPRKVTRLSDGPYALSPDGTSLAVVDGGRLSIVPVGGGKAVSVGEAEAAQPVWMPDSSAVLFVRLGGSTMEIWRVAKSGARPERLTFGTEVAVSPDGGTLVARRDPTGGSMEMGAVYVSLGGGEFSAVTVEGQPTGIAAANDAILVGLVGADGAARVVRMKPDGRDSKELLGAPGGSVSSVWGEFSVSPDGSVLVAGAVGDDGYSRLSVVPIAGGKATTLNERRDAYARGWNASGSELFLIEGNYIQGESTTMYRLRPDGSKRQAVVTGAD